MPVFFLTIVMVAAAPSSASQSSASLPDWNQSVLSALQEHARARKLDPAAAAKKLADVARQLAADPQIRELDRRRLIAKIDRRLGGKRQGVLAQQPVQPADPGAGAQAGGEALKDLIEQTIEPNSWDVNGGSGHIHVFHE